MNPISPSFASIPNANSSPPTASSSAAQYDSFLRLLTAQVKNQDPLSPLDSTQFVEQLATFSSLEQQVRSNNSLDSIASTINSLHAILAGQPPAQPIVIESTWAAYAGTPIAFDFQAPEGIDAAILTVSDPDGTLVFSGPLDLSMQSGQWDGASSATEGVASSGLLRFSIDLFQGGLYAGSIAPQLRAATSASGG